MGRPMVTVIPMKLGTAKYNMNIPSTSLDAFYESLLENSSLEPVNEEAKREMANAHYRIEKRQAEELETGDDQAGETGEGNGQPPDDEGN